MLLEEATEIYSGIKEHLSFKKIAPAHYKQFYYY